MTTRRANRGPILPMPTTRRGKTLFALGLVVWFTLLMMPCALFWFASGHEFTLEHASIPEPLIHPLLQLGTVMNPKERGMKITTSFTARQTDSEMCVETHVNYLLWQSRGGDQSTAFCDCYKREANSWLSTSTTSGNCP